jgi:hypothetical protein
MEELPLHPLTLWRKVLFSPERSARKSWVFRSQKRRRNEQKLIGIALP